MNRNILKNLAKRGASYAGLLGSVVGLFVGGLPLISSALTETHHVFSSFGGRLSMTSYDTETVGAQGQTIGLLSDTADVWSRSEFNFAGFLQPTGVDLQLDTDGDGIPDVVDPDSDNDGLSDVDELLGTYFGGVATDSKNHDTDGDGMSDYGELESGTNPDDEASVFRITQITPISPTEVRIRFNSIGGRQYELFRATNMDGLDAAASIDGTEGAPGNGLFNESETEFSDVPFGGEYFYGIRLVP
ncbi:MAG: hypothetical protein M5U15_05570 [Kiritimatiellae bacterium]|nr:hypothetical protein [Kiritimatiellia bacterium]